MIYRTLGKTGLNVSEIGYGSDSIGNPDLSEKHVEALLNRVLDLGINFIDTAHIYWLSEERIGRYLSKRKDEFILSTKCGNYASYQKGERSLIKKYTKEGIFETIEESRKRLRLDVLDIVLFHGIPEPDDLVEEAFEALFEAKEKGWVKYVGISQDGQAAVDLLEDWPLDINEFSYSILAQEDTDVLIPACLKHQTGMIIKRPIANAVYYADKAPTNGYAAKAWQYAQKISLDELADGMELAEFALRFTLSQQSFGTAIVGTTNMNHLGQNVEVSDGHYLDPSVIQKAQAAFRAVSSVRKL
jgi:aryl-alcohol dehydrogenase-like predicted oxidoreductase